MTAQSTLPAKTCEGIAIPLRAQAHKAMSLYYDTDKTLMEIAVEVDVPASTIMHWATTLGWRKERSLMIGESQQRADEAMLGYMHRQRMSVIERQAKIAHMVEAELESYLEANKGNISTTELRRIAETLSNVSGVEARAVGLDTTVYKEAADAARPVSVQSKKQPLVVLNVTPTLSAAQQPGVDITISEGEEIRHGVLQLGMEPAKRAAEAGRQGETTDLPAGGNESGPPVDDNRGKG